jgi:hypothetical protein
MPNSGYYLALGDSHTRGFLGADWVTPFASAVGAKRAFLRAGVDGQLADAISERLPGILQKHGVPGVATVLAGTNNVLAGYGPGLYAAYAKAGKTR